MGVRSGPPCHGFFCGAIGVPFERFWIPGTDQSYRSRSRFLASYLEGFVLADNQALRRLETSFFGYKPCLLRLQMDNDGL